MPGPRPPFSDDATAAANGPTAPLNPQARAVRSYLFAIATDQGPRLLSFQTGNILMGRLPDNHLSINHVSVSRRHARISIGVRGVTIEDMGSQNGTSVNGSPVKKEHPLHPGDVIRLGHVPLFYFGFYDPQSPPQPETVDHSLAITPSQSSVS